MIEKAGESEIALSRSDEQILTGDVPQTWVVYTRDDGKIVLLCAENNLAMGWSADGSLITAEPEAENECRFDIVEQSGGSVLITEKGALTLENGKPLLRPLKEGDEKQLWRILPVEN